LGVNGNWGYWGEVTVTKKLGTKKRRKKIILSSKSPNHDTKIDFTASGFIVFIQFVRTALRS
jgi:hypothetical protein